MPLSAIIIVCRPLLQSGEALRPLIHDASVRLSSASAFGAFHGSSASTLAASVTIVLKAFSISSQSASDSSDVSRLPPRTIGASRSSSLTSRNFEPELLRVADPGRMVRADQLAAALDVLARDQIGEADDASADAVARLGDGDVIARLRQLVGRGQPAEPAADDDDAARRRAAAAAVKRSLMQERRRGAERALGACRGA